MPYTGNIHLRPSLEQRLMERFEVPIYKIVSHQETVNNQYKMADNLVIVLFTGLDDPILKAVNDTELSKGRHHCCFLYVPRNKEKRGLTMDEMEKFFSWCSELKTDRVMLLFRGNSEFESWTYYNVTNLIVTKIPRSSYPQFLRSQGFRFSVKVFNDPPLIFWYNSTEQADVVNDRNISLSGTIGNLMVEFMRYTNASMDILLTEEKVNSNYDLFQADQRVDLVANLVVNDSLLFSPVMMNTQTCLVVPVRRTIPICNKIHRSSSSIAGDTIFSTFRFNLGVPLPGGQLERLPLADKIIEVYALMFMMILISACGSLLSSALTTGLYYPPITDVESMRASGLRIITEDPTMFQAFKDNNMPSSLTDLVDIVDSQTFRRNFLKLNDSVVFVTQTPKWKAVQMYLERLKTKRIVITGPKLCSNVRQLRLPVSLKSPLRFTFHEYFHRIFESGLEQKWQSMSFKKFREVYGITKLPTDKDNEWRPLSMSYCGFISLYTFSVYF
ncbi:uncharacterized protein LOC110182046 [Drosophila serrata]|uniref:uncharacterized protein LOC110182046 n=1 Tax=Drosophila serrata TaxID=7274 RepID=UPI000A1D0C47|nr:uncharacterized protein LOC110182046 [Drosophila serrata]